MGSKKQSNPASSKENETDANIDANGSNSIQDQHPDKKKGILKLSLDPDELSEVQAYVPICDEYLGWAATISSTTFAMKTYKDSIYWGQINQEKSTRDGRGIIQYNTGRVFEGSWLNDKRHGLGYEEFANGNRYKGEYKLGKVDGQGNYKWKNGDEYEGQFQDGLKHGYGIWKGVNADEYVGEWQYNYPYGFGKHQWANGDFYEGEWKACLRHGKGQDVFHNGDTYIGEYQWGKAEGYG